MAKKYFAANQDQVNETISQIEKKDEAKTSKDLVLANKIEFKKGLIKIEFG